MKLSNHKRDFQNFNVYCFLSGKKQTIEANINGYIHKRGKALEENSQNYKKPENFRRNKGVLNVFEKWFFEKKKKKIVLEFPQLQTSSPNFLCLLLSLRVSDK